MSSLFTSIFNKKDKNLTENDLNQASEKQVDGSKTGPNKRPPAKRSRSEVLQIRLTPEEKAEFEKAVQRSGLSRTDYFLNAIRGNVTVVCEGLPELLYELNKQGTNLNQMAKLANERHDPSVEGLYAAVKNNGLAVAKVYELISNWEIKLTAAKSKSKSEKGE